MIELPKINDGGGPQSPALNWNLSDACAAGLGENIFSRTMSGIATTTGSVQREVWDGSVTSRGLANVETSTGQSIVAVSTSAVDTAAGIGAQQVLVTYIEAETLFERFAIGTMNGTSTTIAFVEASWQTVNGLRMPVASVTPVTDAVRLNRAKVIGVGSNMFNAGDIEISLTGPANPQLQIPGAITGAHGYNRDASGFFFCPRGSFYMLTGITTGTTLENAGVRFTISARAHTPTPINTIDVGLWETIATAHSVTNSGALDRSRHIPTMTDVRVEVYDFSGGAEQVNATLSAIEVYDLSVDPEFDLRPGPL